MVIRDVFESGFQLYSRSPRLWALAGVGWGNAPIYFSLILMFLSSLYVQDEPARNGGRKLDIHHRKIVLELPRFSIFFFRNLSLFSKKNLAYKLIHDWMTNDDESYIKFIPPTYLQNGFLIAVKYTY